jgi:hypothetical protein
MTQEPESAMTAASGFVGWVQPAIRPGVVVDCTRPTREVLTTLGL